MEDGLMLTFGLIIFAVYLYFWFSTEIKQEKIERHFEQEEVEHQNHVQDK